MLALTTFIVNDFPMLFLANLAGGPGAAREGEVGCPRAGSAGGIANFGENMRSEENVLLLGLHNLTVALDVFQLSYDRVGELMPEFTRLCETNLKTRDDGDT
jgi:hypothetical protein